VIMISSMGPECGDVALAGTSKEPADTLRCSGQAGVTKWTARALGDAFCREGAGRAAKRERFIGRGPLQDAENRCGGLALLRHKRDE
jgi:hypothetical protein